MNALVRLVLLLAAVSASASALPQTTSTARSSNSTSVTTRTGTGSTTTTSTTTTSTTSGSSGSTAAGAVPGASAGAGMSVDMMACSAAVLGAASDKCMSQLTTDAMSLADVLYTASSSDAVYAPLKTLVTNMCTDTCTATFRNVSASVVSGCAAAVTSEAATSFGWSVPKGSEAIVGNVAKDVLWFGKDLVCLRDVKSSNQLCSVQALELSQKYKLFTAKPTTIKTGSGATGSGTLTAALPGLVSSGSSVTELVLPALNAEALKAVPKAELCTACAATSYSQVAIYLKTKLAPVVATFNKTMSSQLSADADKLVNDVNGVCGAGFASSSGALLLGVDKPITTVGAQSAGAAGAPGSAAMAALAFVAAALVTLM